MDDFGAHHIDGNADAQRDSQPQGRSQTDLLGLIICLDQRLKAHDFAFIFIGQCFDPVVQLFANLTVGIVVAKGSGLLQRLLASQPHQFGPKADEIFGGLFCLSKFPALVSRKLAAPLSQNLTKFVQIL